MEKLAYTIDEAAALTNHGRSFLYRMIREGKLRARKSGAKTLILPADLEAFVTALPVSRDTEAA